MSPAATRSEPTWLAEVRERARAFARATGLPARSVEAWRKVDLTALSIEGRLEAARPSRTTLTGAEPIEPGAATDETAEIVKEALENRARENEATYFTALNAAAGDLTLLRLSGTSADPVRVKHEADAATATTVCPRLMIQVESGAELTIVEEFRFNEAVPGSGVSDANASDALRLIAPLTDVYCAPNSRVNYVMIGDFGPDDFHMHHFRARLMRDSRLNLYLFPLGGFSGKSFYQSEAREPGAECHAYGCAVGRAREFNDMDITMAHHANHTFSSILYRSVVRDRSHHVFYGNLNIDPGLKNVDSHQSNNNILLDRRARAESMPNLIVRAEDVSAEHGATVGELDKEALYFLMARGIPEDEARDLLIEGFINSILEKIPGDSLREEIDGALKERLD